jgi:hypothetical protein
LHDSISPRQLAAPHGPDGVASTAVGIELTEDAPESLEAKLVELEASTRKLQYANLELRLRLERRKSRSALQSMLLAIGAPSLLLLGLVVGIFLGLVVGSMSNIR